MSARPDVLLDVRETSHSSAGMLQYVRALRAWLPRVAPDLRVEPFGSGDNFDLAEQVGMPLAILRRRPRLVHVPTLYVPRVVPAPLVVTIHDLIHLEFPQYQKRKVAPYWRAVVAPVLRGARAVLTDDEATVPLLARYAGVRPERVRVIPLGVDVPDPLPPPARRARPFLFYAGNHRAHKDLSTLLRAWSALPPRYEVDLVLTGDPEPALAARRAGGELVFLGACDDATVWAHHRGAVAYVHPALREGFGLPLLEALRVGTPVVAATTATPQAVRPWVREFPPGDADALAERLAALLDAPSDARAEAHRAAAATAGLTWERTVASTAAVYRELLA